MIHTGIQRRRIGLVAWGALAMTTAIWLWDARATLHIAAWPILLAPFPLLVRGLLEPSRNAWLLALLATVGYATLGVMDAIANPASLVLAATLAAMSLIAFFGLIPAIRTMPAPPRPPDE
ncbi:MAG: hypothetical protein AAF270_12700 [Pseudomonadota bacterium]